MNSVQKPSMTIITSYTGLAPQFTVHWDQGERDRKTVKFDKPNLYRTCSYQQTGNSTTYNSSIWTS
jgi:hypothetical protein